MRVAISGASGLVGTALREALEAAGDEVLPMVRPGSEPPAGESIEWNPAAGRLDPADLEGVDAVVHLAGESIEGVWTAAKKRRIRSSRVDGTRLVAEAMAAAGGPPVLVSVSGAHFYGHRGDARLDERADSGSGFMAEVCRAWEAAADPARSAGIRVVHPRLGLVLSPRGGLLPRLLLPFRLGLGGRLGDGSQWMSWLTLDDLVEILRTALRDPALEGPLNAVSPEPVTNRDFTRILADVLGRPALLPAPGFALRLLPGDMGRELLLSSVRVLPAVLREREFTWRDPELRRALDRLLARRQRPVGTDGGEDAGSR